MSLLENILYGLVSGITEFLPVSARGHQSLLRYLFGVSARSSFQDLLVHIGVILSILIACWQNLVRLHREQRSSLTRRRKSHALDSKNYYDLRLLKTATVPLLAGMLLYSAALTLEGNLLSLMVLLIANGVILLFTEHTRRGNRDARTMSGLDGIAMGVVGAVSVFPGISRTGMIASYATLRGADSQGAVNWAILLGIPATFFAICYDVLQIFSSGIGAVSALMLAGNILAGLAAFCGGYIGISVLRLISAHSGMSQFAYYSIGAAMFTFILYLLT